MLRGKEDFGVLPIRLRALITIVGAALAMTLMAPVGAVGAAGAGPSSFVVADGLHSPRGLDFGPGGILYVAESGDATHGGAVLQIRNSASKNPTARTIVDGLPTIGDEGEFIGIDGISVLGRGTNQTIFGVFGLAPQNAGSADFGRVVTISRAGNLSTITNIGQFDFDWGKAHSFLWEEFVAGDANPYGILALPGHLYVVDAGENTLNEVHPDGSIDILAYFPNEAIRDAIPTCVRQGPDGALYIGTLAFVDSAVLGPSAKVYRVDPSQANLAEPWNTPMTVWASGLWPINGCDFGPNGTFYASQLFTNPAWLFSGGLAPAHGDVVAIPWGSPSTHRSLANGSLGTTAGVAVGPNGTVFVSNNTVGPGGQVLRLSNR
jgi:hypothetical protein